jgi:homocysteine S-methyltransferase
MQVGMIREIHREYLSAGPKIIETNTFGGNRVRLELHGLGKKVKEINYAGATIAREIGGDKAWIGGSVGPLGKPIKPIGVVTLDESRSIFREQVEALVEGGVDFILLETFTDLREII